jgi:DNA-binding NarL/FixJ family response regulator
MKTQEEKRKKESASKISVLIVDDHPIVRQGFTQLINQEPDLLVCGEAENPTTAMELIDRLNPDIVLVDISLKEGNGIELVKTIRKHDPLVLMLVVSMHEESIYAERALRAGAKGYIMKHEATEKMLAAMRCVLGGKIYISDKVNDKILNKVADNADKDLSPVDTLSDRELDVFRLLGQGQNTKQIAKKLFLSVKTVETYRANIKEKLHLENANSLVHFATQWTEKNSLS